MADDYRGELVVNMLLIILFDFMVIMSTRVVTILPCHFWSLNLSGVII